MEMAQLQQSAVHNHTAAMLEMGTNLLSQTAEQTRKLTDVETQVMTPPHSPDLTTLIIWLSGHLLLRETTLDRTKTMIAMIAYWLSFAQTYMGTV